MFHSFLYVYQRVTWINMGAITTEFGSHTHRMEDRWDGPHVLHPRSMMWSFNFWVLEFIRYLWTYQKHHLPSGNSLHPNFLICFLDALRWSKDDQDDQVFVLAWTTPGLASEKHPWNGWFAATSKNTEFGKFSPKADHRGSRSLECLSFGANSCSNQCHLSGKLQPLISRGYTHRPVWFPRFWGCFGHSGHVYPHPGAWTKHRFPWEPGKIRVLSNAQNE